MNPHFRKCPECGGQNLHCAFTNSGGGYGPILLPALGRFFSPAKFQVVLCADCGLTRFYAEPRALAKLANSGQWTRM